MSSSTSYFQRASTTVLLYLIRETFMLFSYLRVSWSCCVQVVGLWSPSTGGKRNEKVSFLVLHVPCTLSHILHTVSTNGKFQWVTPKQTVFKDSTESLNTGCRHAKIDIMYFILFLKNILKWQKSMHSINYSEACPWFHCSAVKLQSNRVMFEIVFLSTHLQAVYRWNHHDKVIRKEAAPAV